MRALVLVALSACSASHALHDRTVPTYAKVLDASAAMVLGAAAMLPAVTPDPRTAHATMGVAMGILLTDMIVLWATGAE